MVRFSQTHGITRRLGRHFVNNFMSYILQLCLQNLNITTFTSDLLMVTVRPVVRSPASLVTNLLRDALLRIRRQCSLHTVNTTGDALLDLLASRLFVVRSYLFGNLSAKVFTVRV